MFIEKECTASSIGTEHQHIWIRAILHHLASLSTNSAKRRFINFCNNVHRRPIFFTTTTAELYITNSSHQSFDLPVILSLSKQLALQFKMSNEDPENFTKADILTILKELASSAKTGASLPKPAHVLKIAEPSRFSGQRDIAFIDSWFLTMERYLHHYQVDPVKWVPTAIHFLDARCNEIATQKQA